MQLCIIEYINKKRRQLGIKNIPWGSRMPAGYIEGILQAVADGMSMAIRLKSAGCIIATMCDLSTGGSSSKKGRKRTAAAAAGDGAAQQQQQHTMRPNYCNALDFGNFYDSDNTEDDDDEHPLSSGAEDAASVVDVESSSSGEDNDDV